MHSELQYKESGSQVEWEFLQFLLLVDSVEEIRLLVVIWCQQHIQHHVLQCLQCTYIHMLTIILVNYPKRLYIVCIYWVTLYRHYVNECTPVVSNLVFYHTLIQRKGTRGHTSCRVH